MSNLHPSAAAGYAAKSDIYVRGRPDYPEALQDWLRQDLRLGQGQVVVDLGAGTGKFVPVLRGIGATVTAIEPVPEMLAQLKLKHPDVDARIGTAERIPLPDGSVDAVVCAQAFHWFSSELVMAEIRRVLRTGGRLGLVWNVRDESVDWVAGLTRIMAPYEGDVPRYRSMQWRRPFPAIGFTPLAERVLPHGATGTPEDVIVARILSVSFIAALPQTEQDRVAVEIRSLIEASPDLRGRREVTFPYVTAAFSCRKLM